jgi:hypothetical protein
MLMPDEFAILTVMYTTMKEILRVLMCQLENSKNKIVYINVNEYLCRAILSGVEANHHSPNNRATCDVPATRQ